MSVEKSIGWAEKTLNPILGLCPPEYRCSYCYVPPFYKRFGWDTTPRLDLSVFDAVGKRRKPTRYFLCSTHDLFGEWVPNSWIVDILHQIILNHPHTFCILTKYPDRARNWTMPKNAWLGVTVNRKPDIHRVVDLGFCNVGLRSISFEPLLGAVDMPSNFWGMMDWIIIGALTLPGGRTKQPEREWVESLIDQAERHKIPIFLKDNLKIDGLVVPLQPDGSFKRQEFPQQKDEVMPLT